jgi:hypothetical protein
MYPRHPARQVVEYTPVPPSAVTHAHVARKLLQRAVRHLKHAEKVEKTWPSSDDSQLLQQALERLAVADLLIDAYTTPLPVRTAAEQDGDEVEAM